MPDGVRGLDPLFYFKPDSCICQRCVDRSNKFIDFLILVANVAVDLGCNRVECLGFLITQPDIFHFRFYTIKTKPVGEGNEDEHGLAQYLVSLVFRHELYGAAIVEPVCKFDQNYAHIIIKGKQDALKVFGLHALLLSLVLVVKDRLDLRKPFDKSGNLVSEKVFQVVYGIVCIFHDIMKQSSHDGFVAKSDVADDDFCHSYRM